VKIAHFIRALDVGGAERVTVDLANAFAARNEDVTIFAAWPADTGSPVQSRLSPKVRVEYVGTARESPAATYLAAALWAWRNRRRLSEYDVLHCHLTYGAFIGTLLHSVYLRRARRPAIVETYHSVGAPIPTWTQWLHSTMARRRDVFVLMATDSYWSRFTEKHRTLPVRLILNGARTPDVHGVDEPARRRYRSELGIPDQARFVVGSIGMLRRDRQPSAFLPVIAGLVREFGEDVHWIFGGDGAEREALEGLVSDAGLTANVHFSGLLLDVRYLLSVLDLHFTITVRDVGGVAAIEGALAGIPTIGLQAAADHHTTDDWIWSSVAPGPLCAMAIRLLRNPAERSTLATRQQHYAREHHSVERMAQSYRDVYLEAMRALGKLEQ
jgi:glycosyltransferase involved in cell wall biosynthesis